MPVSDVGTGWIPDLHDHRDHTHDHPEIAPLLQKAGVATDPAAVLPPSVDLREWFSDVYDQGKLNACTANTTAALTAYYEKRSFGKSIPESRLFLYKVARNVVRVHHDIGLFLRTTMQALAVFGSPPEEYWPYDPNMVDIEPSAFCYAMASNYRALQYFRCDPHGADKRHVVARIKGLAAAKLPTMFGFYIFPGCMMQAVHTGAIPYPGSDEKPTGGHAMVVAGYDDNMRIHNETTDHETVGAFLIRNSWGTGWGDGGYGWLPYAYVLGELATDWWCLLKEAWIDTNQFGPAV